MPTGTIVIVWQRQGRIHASVRVDEGLPLGNVEYNADVALTDAFDPATGLPDPQGTAFTSLTAAQKKLVLQQAIKAVRDADPMIAAGAVTPIAGITGSVTI